jgi:hypothetical protein
LDANLKQYGSGMRKMIQFKPMMMAPVILASGMMAPVMKASGIMALGALTLSAVVGLAGVQAQSSAQPSYTLPAPSTPQTNRPETPSTKRAQVADNVPTRRGNRMVCKEEAILGTRLKGMRTCRTADEWRRVARGFQSKFKDLNDKGAAVYSGN